MHACIEGVRPSRGCQTVSIVLEWFWSRLVKFRIADCGVERAAIILCGRQHSRKVPSPAVHRHLSTPHDSGLQAHAVIAPAALSFPSAAALQMEQAPL